MIHDYLSYRTFGGCNEDFGKGVMRTCLPEAVEG